MVRPKRFELLAYRFVACCSIQLSYERAKRNIGKSPALVKRFFPFFSKNMRAVSVCNALRFKPYGLSLHEKALSFKIVIAERRCLSFLERFTFEKGETRGGSTAPSGPK